MQLACSLLSAPRLAGIQQEGQPSSPQLGAAPIPTFERLRGFWLCSEQRAFMLDQMETGRAQLAAMEERRELLRGEILDGEQRLPQLRASGLGLPEYAPDLGQVVQIWVQGRGLLCSMQPCMSTSPRPRERFSLSGF